MKWRLRVTLHWTTKIDCFLLVLIICQISWGFIFCKVYRTFRCFNYHRLMGQSCLTHRKKPWSRERSVILKHYLFGTQWTKIDSFLANWVQSSMTSNCRVLQLYFVLCNLRPLTDLAIGQSWLFKTRKKLRSLKKNNRKAKVTACPSTLFICSIPAPYHKRWRWGLGWPRDTNQRPSLKVDICNSEDASRVCPHTMSW